MNGFFNLLRDIIIFIPLTVLAFGIIFSLISLRSNESMLPFGLIIFLYGLVASYSRQFYKDLINFLREEKLPKKRRKKWSDEEWNKLLNIYPDYLKRWKRYHRYYYIAQLSLLVLFIFIYFIYFI